MNIDNGEGGLLKCIVVWDGAASGAVWFEDFVMEYGELMFCVWVCVCV